jgi:hypothetical protein
MQVTKIQVVDKRGTVLAKLTNKVKQKRMQGMYENKVQSPAEILSKKRGYNFKKEFTQYVDENYGDILSKKDIENLKELVEEHYDDQEGIPDIENLHEHIEQLGKEHNILFD